MRRISANIGLVAALENETPPVVDTPAAAPVVADNANSLETDMVEVADAGADVDALNSDIAETADVAEALESIAEVLGQAAKNGGIDRHSAAVVAVATDALYARVGVSTSRFPAMESFGSTSSKAAATKVAMEEIKETVKKIWDAIVAAFKRAIQFVIDFWNKVTDASGKMGKRAEELKKAAGELKGEMTEKEIKNDRIAASLDSSKGAGNAEIIGNLVKLVEDVNSGKNAEKTIVDGGNVAEALGASKEFVEKFSVKGGAPGANFSEVSGGTAPEGCAVYKSGELPGRKAVTAIGAKADATGEAAVKAYAESKYEIGAFDPAHKAEEHKPLATLDKAGITSMAEAAGAIAKALATGKQHADKMNEVKKKVAEKAEQLGKAAAALEEGSADAKAFADARRVAQAFVRLCDQPAVMITSYAISTGKALCDYAELSIKNYGEKKEEKKEEPAAAAAAA
jgi:hypothetical protein